ncbi:type IV secretion system protein VirB2 [Cupriavidus basilensis OR16]|uniref:Type IV secretion system protein VirB2 n=1 Tax=Cupriavidus basilensis OR16 TaxID=1127483 RepID=H1RZU4_9BURK|nr:TrbC/VirB2 family protein [Cupriavidus basilensis]EHP44160.1 type IV secretion system protein VirB2 [Cupriavidus basilensis OR16]
MESNQLSSDARKVATRNGDRIDTVLNYMGQGVVIAFLLLPEFAHAQAAGGLGAGVTQFLKQIINLLIFEWGYYIAIAALVIQGYRWWTGHISLLDLGKWGFGLFLVFFAPNIVSQFRSGASGVV